MTEVRFYYADSLEAVLGRQFKDQELAFIYLDSERMSEEDLKVAEKYIQEDGGTGLSQCRGREGFDHHVEERRQTYEHAGKGLVPVVVTTLPARERRLFTRFTERREKAAIEKVSSLEEQGPKAIHRTSRPCCTT